MENAVQHYRQACAQVQRLLEFADAPEQVIVATLRAEVGRAWRERDWIAAWVGSPRQAVSYFAHATQELVGLLERKRQELADAENRMVTLRARPIPTPGTKEAEQLAAEARQTEALCDRLKRDVRTGAECLPSSPTEVIERARRGLKRVLVVALPLIARWQERALETAAEEAVKHVRATLHVADDWQHLLRSIEADTGSLPVPRFEVPESWRKIEQERPHLAASPASGESAKAA